MPKTSRKAPGGVDFEASQLLKRQLLEAVQRRVRHLCERERISQAEMSRQLGLSGPRISSLMTSRLNLFSLEALIEIASTLNLSVKLGVSRPYERKAG